ncbi:MAG: tetratricopeptide repeat protein [Betaproteobacteria bacterium]|nr:tetratricopeptide repeat protein [Betaproteobacteria bacterium]
MACLCLANPAKALAPTQIFSQASPSVVVLETFDEKNQRLGSHTATVIEPERLVATCDVLETAATLRVATTTGSVISRVTARDRERNLCLISAPGLTAVPIPKLTQILPVGSRVFAMSNALGLGIGISEGVISGIRNFSPGAYVQFSAPISPGSEGGALVDDGGQLVGIIDYRRRDGQNVNFASMAQWISEIEPRALASEARLKRFDRAMALSKQQQWNDLQAMAATWPSEEPEAKDAWRFVVAAARERGDTEAELQGWKALYRIDSSSIEAGTGLGRAFMASGKTREALDLARQLQTTHQQDAMCWLFLAQAQQVSGQTRDAEQSYRRAVELDPWLIDAYRGTAVLAQMRGDSQTAIAVWKRLSGLFSNQLWPRTGLAGAYLAAGKPALAWSTLGQVADSDTDNALVWYLRGVTLFRIGCPEQAIQAYRKSLDHKLANADWAWAGIASALSEIHRFPEAIDAIRSAVQAAPANDEWRYQLAINLKDGGRANEALAITADLVEKKPEEAKNWRQHGFVLAELERTAEAIPAMEKSLQIESRQAKLWAALIESYQIAGRRDDAKRAYEQLRSIDGAMAESLYREAILPYEERL